VPSETEKTRGGAHITQPDDAANNATRRPGSSSNAGAKQRDAEQKMIAAPH
jgi:hypothetical protein